MLSKNGKDMHLTVWFSSKYVNLASSSLTQHQLSNVNISHFCIEQIQGKRKTTWFTLLNFCPKMTCSMQKSKTSQSQSTEKKDNYKELCSDSMIILYAHALLFQFNGPLEKAFKLIISEVNYSVEYNTKLIFDVFKIVCLRFKALKVSPFINKALYLTCRWYLYFTPGAPVSVHGILPYFLLPPVPLWKMSFMFFYSPFHRAFFF